MARSDKLQRRASRVSYRASKAAKKGKSRKASRLRAKASKLSSKSRVCSVKRGRKRCRVVKRKSGPKNWIF